MAPVLARHPAVAVAVAGELEGLRLGEALADPLLDLGPERRQAVALDRVLEARVLAALAVAPVALDRHHGLGHPHGVVGFAEQHQVGGAREGVGLAMGHAHAAAHRDVPAGHAVLLVENRDEAEIVGEDVDLVRGRHRDHDLEFPRQVGLAVDRLDEALFLAADDALAVEPDLAPGAGLGQQRVRDGPGEVVGGLVGAGLGRVRGRHHVSVHVAAGRDRVEKRPVDRRHGPAQVRLDDAVILEGLARRRPQGAVGVSRRDIVEGQPLLRRHDAARDAQADHEAVGLVELLLGALGAKVAVVLQVHPVEFHELAVIVRDRASGVLQEPVRQRPPEIAAGDLQVLVVCEPGGAGRLGLVDGAFGRRRLVDAPGIRLAVVHGGDPVFSWGNRALRPVAPGLHQPALCPGPRWGRPLIHPGPPS
ncbi:hypothetical protein AEGHOMDF_2303 [Methylobacterium soli]|nr:hypothetical protein AEGHOMDF_2303 [Methylobacterium soli]